MKLDRRVDNRRGRERWQVAGGRWQNCSREQKLESPRLGNIDRRIW